MVAGTVLRRPRVLRLGSGRTRIIDRADRPHRMDVLDWSTWWTQGWITTIEGNITNGGNPAVGIFQRSASVISGFGMPNYQTTPTPDPIPVATSEEDPMIVLRNPKGWHVVMGNHLIRVGGGKDFNMVRSDVDRNTVRIDVSDAQLAQIKAEFAK